MPTLKTRKLEPARFPYHGYRVQRESDRLYYTVMGRGIFPEDMLRYDSGSLEDPKELEVTREDEAFLRIREVNVIAKGCTPLRWKSFGWVVLGGIEEKFYR